MRRDHRADRRLHGIVDSAARYLKRIREICDRHGICLFFDEVITGLGGTVAHSLPRSSGDAHILTTAKGLTTAA